MTTYKELFGKAVKFLSSDPANDAEGQVWYNSTTGTFRSVVVGGSWSSSGGLGTARYALGKGTTGTQTASIAALGRTSTGATGVTEEYNGSGWSTGGTANTARYGTGCFGTQTALVVAGGTPPFTTAAEEYNGSSWTTITSIPSTARSYLAGFGVETAGAVFGGGATTPGDTVFTTTDEYNGSSWTAGGNLNTGRNRIASTGTLTAGIAATGAVLPFNTASGVAEEYNGTAWTNVTSVNTPRYNVAGFGIQTATVIAGGTPSNTATETWDGSSWATSPATLGTGTAAHSAGGDSGTAGLVFGGNPPGISNTEEYNFSASVIIGAAWTSGGTVPVANQDLAGFGTQTAAIGAGGYSGPYTNVSYSYDGSTWTNTSPINTARTAEGAGTQTAGVIFGGNAPPADAVQNLTEEWNGSTWTNVNNMVSAVTAQFAIGATQTAVISAGGSSPTIPVWNTQQDYDGTSWTNSPATLNNGRHNGGSHGTASAALISNGTSPPGFPDNVQSYSEEYNGTAWTTTPATNLARKSSKGFGLQTNAIATGGTNLGPIIYAQSESYDGTGWVTSASLATGRYSMAPAGVGSPSGSGMVFNGAPGYSTATEEFNDETSVLNYKTITTS